MAPRRSRRLGAVTTTTSNEPNPATQQIIEMVNSTLRDSTDPDVLFEIEAPIETSVLMTEGGYKVKPFRGGEEILFKRIRAGKRSEFIFEFMPCDAQPFTQIEFTEKKVFAALSGFEARVVAMIGGKDGDSWAHTCRRLGTTILEEAARTKAAIEASADSIYESNPNYGIF